MQLCCQAPARLCAPRLAECNCMHMQYINVSMASFKWCDKGQDGTQEVHKQNKQARRYASQAFLVYKLQSSLGLGWQDLQSPARQDTWACLDLHLAGSATGW